MAGEFTMRVWRGDSSGGDFVDYKVQVQEGMVVLDVIHQIQATQAGDLLRGMLQGSLGQLNHTLGTLSDRLGREQDMLERMVGSQQALLQHLAQRGDKIGRAHV